MTEDNPPDTGDKIDKITVLRRLLNFTYLPDDAELTDPMDLVSALYKRIRLADDIKRTENSGSWDYCKQAAIDFYKKERRWIPIHEHAFHYQRGCVPPHYMTGNYMMVGEAFTGPYHLTIYTSPSGKYWCCLATKNEILSGYAAKLPYDHDLPMMGIPTDGEVDS